MTCANTAAGVTVVYLVAERLIRFARGRQQASTNDGI